MVADTKNIMVLLRSVRDPKVPAAPSSSGFGIRERGARHIMNPADRSALVFVLDAARENGAKITVVSYETSCSEDVLREALAMGVDRAVLLQGFNQDSTDTMVEGKILARLVQLLGCGLVCTGTRLTDRGAAMAPAVAASLLEWCCVHSVVGAEIGSKTVSVMKKSDRGGRQEVTAPLPTFLLFEEVAESIYPGVEQLLGSRDAELETWTLSDIGMSLLHGSAFTSYTRLVGTSISRPRPVAVTTPDPGLPAFERILSLLEGGIKTREGKLRFLTAAETADRLLATVQAGRQTGEPV